jgi:hypothetical protein
MAVPTCKNSISPEFSEPYLHQTAGYNLSLTVVSPSLNELLSAVQAASSIRAIMAGVAKTSKLPLL